MSPIIELRSPSEINNDNQENKIARSVPRLDRKTSHVSFNVDRSKIVRRFSHGSRLRDNERFRKEDVSRSGMRKRRARHLGELSATRCVKLSNTPSFGTDRKISRYLFPPGVGLVHREVRMRDTLTLRECPLSHEAPLPAYHLAE